MSQITREGRVYAEQCRACGQETTANKILHLCDWIDVCEHSIVQQRNQIADLQEQVGTFRMKIKGGRNRTTFTAKADSSEGNEQ